MNLLAAALYDPAVAVNKVTTAALAMTALDTTNLRLVFTVPPSGRVRVRLVGVIHGATTFPSILLGVMNGAAVVGRVAPVQSLGNTAVATALVTVEADFVVTGLTPGTSTTWDAAYGVETLVASTGLKYGGPNNTTANDAFGAFLFEIWDVSPVYTPASGVPPTTTPHQKLDTITTSVTEGYKKNTAFNNFMFMMLDSTTGLPKTGLVDGGFTKKQSIDGAAGATLTGTITEVDATNMPGWYKINLSAGELNGNIIGLRFTASGTFSTDLTLKTSP